MKRRDLSDVLQLDRIALAQLEARVLSKPVAVATARGVLAALEGTDAVNAIAALRAVLFRVEEPVIKAAQRAAVETSRAVAAAERAEAERRAAARAAWLRGERPWG